MRLPRIERTDAFEPRGPFGGRRTGPDGAEAADMNDEIETLSCETYGHCVREDLVDGDGDGVPEVFGESFIILVRVAKRVLIDVNNKSGV